jgi:hypothetical protein
VWSRRGLASILSIKSLSLPRIVDGGHDGKGVATAEEGVLCTRPLSLCTRMRSIVVVLLEDGRDGWRLERLIGGSWDEAGAEVAGPTHVDVDYKSIVCGGIHKREEGMSCLWGPQNGE